MGRAYIERKVMQQIAQIAHLLRLAGVLFEMFHQELDHVLDGLRALLHLRETVRRHGVAFHLRVLPLTYFGENIRCMLEQQKKRIRVWFRLPLSRSLVQEGGQKAREAWET